MANCQKCGAEFSLPQSAHVGICSECQRHGAKSADHEDYYYDKGFLVFTREYHLQRGYCCKSGCRHCPYP